MEPLFRRVAFVFIAIVLSESCTSLVTCIHYRPGEDTQSHTEASQYYYSSITYTSQLDL